MSGSEISKNISQLICRPFSKEKWWHEVDVWSGSQSLIKDAIRINLRLSYHAGRKLHEERSSVSEKERTKEE